TDNSGGDVGVVFSRQELRSQGLVAGSSFFVSRHLTSRSRRAVFVPTVARSPAPARAWPGPRVVHEEKSMSVFETSATPDRLPQRIRLPLRFRRVQVAAVERPAPRLVRITVAGDELDGFDSPGFDD